MQIRVKTLFGHGRSFLASAALSLLMFSYCSAPSLRAGSLPGRQALLALLVFVLLFVALRLFAVVCGTRLRIEHAHLEPGQELTRGLKIFVLYKEAVKTTVGVSLTLAWIAGLLLVADKLGNSFFLVPLAAGTAITALLSALAYIFVVFVDHVPYPWGQQ